MKPVKVADPFSLSLARRGSPDWLREQGLIKDAPGTRKSGKFGKPVAFYDYTDEDGTVLSQNVR